MGWFSDIPIRDNGHKVRASWFNDIRTKLINLPLTEFNSGSALNGDLLTADGLGGFAFLTPGFGVRNWAQNPGFNIWQRATSSTTANAGRNYVCDRWYTNNALGTNGVITTSRQTGNVAGSKYGLKQLITTAPTAAQANGCELYQVLENVDSLNFYNKTASFSIYARAFGNVTQIGIQFFYATSEIALTTAIGSEVTATVSTSADTLIKIDGQALGTSMTTSGVIGVRIRITGVSSGNTYDLNNGFQVEQAMLNLGGTAGAFNKADYSELLRQCLRFYEKSYDPETLPGTATNNGAAASIRSGSLTAGQVFFKVTKRTAPTLTIYSTVTGASGKIRDTTAGADENSSETNTGATGFTEIGGLGSDGNRGAFQWTANAEI